MLAQATRLITEESPQLRYYRKHKKRCLQYRREYRKTHIAEIRQYQKEHATETRQYSKKWADEHKEYIKEKNREYRKMHTKTIREYRQSIKYLVYSHYSKGEPQCAFCGISDIDVLCVDHVNNDGAEHRRIRNSNSTLLWWLKKNNYPEGFQILCANCNLKKEILRRRNAHD